MFLLQRMCNSYLSIRFVTLQNIPIENLSRGRPQDNLEFLQFLKNLYDKLYEERDYDPIKRRQYSKGGKGMLFPLFSLRFQPFGAWQGTSPKWADTQFRSLLHRFCDLFSAHSPFFDVGSTSTSAATPRNAAPRRTHEASRWFEAQDARVRGENQRTGPISGEFAVLWA